MIELVPWILTHELSLLVECWYDVYRDFYLYIFEEDAIATFRMVTYSSH